MALLRRCRASGTWISAGALVNTHRQQPTANSPLRARANAGAGQLRLQHRRTPGEPRRRPSHHSGTRMSPANPLFLPCSVPARCRDTLIIITIIVRLSLVQTHSMHSCPHHSRRGQASSTQRHLPVDLQLKASPTFRAQGTPAVLSSAGS